MIKAIETSYRGYRFRSRLEARWAVYFDHAGIAWEYEKEGYDLEEAGWYLPDFWLPDFDCFIEVKPEAPCAGDAKKIRILACRHKPVMLCCGLPPGDNLFFCQEGSSPSGGGLCVMSKPMIGYCHNCCRMVIDFGDWDDAYDDGNVILLDGEWEAWKNPCRCSPPHTQRVSFSETDAAARAARSTRFEHGEGGIQ